MYFHINAASGTIDKKDYLYKELKSSYNIITFDLSPPAERRYPLFINNYLHFIEIKYMKQLVKLDDFFGGIGIVMLDFNINKETKYLTNTSDLDSIRKLKVSKSLIIYDDFIE